MSDFRFMTGRALVVVAHPDDETVWMGGMILSFPRVKWTIFSLCRADDTDRAPKFKRVCKFLGARAVISDLDDEEILSLLASLSEIRDRLRRFLFTLQNRGSSRSGGGMPAASHFADSALRRPSSAKFRELLQDKQKALVVQSRRQSEGNEMEFDFVFTHGYNGEYGHPRHRGVHAVVKQMIRDGEIRAKRFYNFSYALDERKNICRPKKADVFVKLSPIVFGKKRKIINEIYGFRKSTFEYKTLSRVESFKVIKT